MAHRSSTLAASAALLFLLAGCGARGDGEAPAPTGAARGGGPGGPGGAGQPPPEVVVHVVTPRRVAVTAELPGRVTPQSVAEVRPQVGGIVRERLFEEGATVKAGEVLFRIDPAPFAARLEQAEASLASARAAARIAELLAERYRRLLPEGSISRQDLDNAETAAEQARARVLEEQAAAGAARINLEWTRVTAPIAGRTGRSLVPTGALVSAGQPAPLTTVTRLDPVYVDVTQSSTDVLRLRRAAAGGGKTAPDAAALREVRLNLEDGTPYELAGELQLAEVQVEESAGTVTLRARFPNPDGLLLPGMYVRALVTERIDEQALLVPQQAVARDRRGNASARIVDAEGRIAIRPVTTSRAIGNEWLVGSGLAAGDRVIVEGALNAQPGTPVRIATAP